jgi:predicted amidohydrolase YtcJ
MTMESRPSHATAVAVGDGRILAVGDDADDPRTRRPAGRGGSTSAGRTSLPGFVDAHCHPLLAGRRAAAVRPARPPESTRRLHRRDPRRMPTAHPELDWIVGSGWAMAAFPRRHASARGTSMPWSPIDPRSQQPRRPRGWVNRAGARARTGYGPRPRPVDGPDRADRRRQPAGHAPRGSVARWSERLVPDAHASSESPTASPRPRPTSTGSGSRPGRTPGRRRGARCIPAVRSVRST